jgi:shikimate dehydrogenase
MNKTLWVDRSTGGSPPVFALDGNGDGNVIRVGSEPVVRAHTRLMGLLGADVRHADLAFAFNNRLLSLWDHEFLYLPYSVRNGHLADAVRGVRALDILSCNVTFPHKVTIMEHLDEIDEETRRMGSVNLVVNRDGVLWGYNTDSEGFMHALRESGFAPELQSALIFGCGGAGRALAATLAAAGMERVWVYDIVEEKCQSVEWVHNHNGRQRVVSATRKQLASLRPGLIVNATPLGRGKEADVSPVDDEMLAGGLANAARLFFDLNYNPPHSRFLQQAERLGIAAENGLRMMCYQAKRSIEIAARREIPWEWYEEAIEEECLTRYMVSASTRVSAAA